VKNRATKAYRAACFQLCKAARLTVPDGPLYLFIEFVPPDRRRRDDDNLIGCFKPGRDGVAEALGIDDSRFLTRHSFSESPVKGGAVRVRIEPR
jgi:crossover junction endodeoxyribonuclease RusA